MGRSKTLIAMAILILLSAFPPAAAQDRIRIGVVTTGNEDTQFMAGVTAAQKDQGQIANRPVEVIFHDHQNKPDRALAMSRQLTEVDNVNFLVIKGGEHVMLATAGVGEQQRTPTLFIGLSKKPFSDQQKKYSFHIGDSVELLAKLAVRYAKDNQGGRTSFLFESPFYADALNREAPAGRLPLEKWNNAPGSPAIVFAFDRDAPAIPLDTLPSSSLLVGGTNLIAGQGRLGNQIKAAAIALRDPSLGRPQDLPISLRDMKGAEPFYGYAAFQILARAAQNDPTGNRVAEKMRSDPFDTVVGRVSFMDGGECRQPKLSVYVMNNNGAFELCPECAGVHDGCSGTACKCKDGSCNNDCCNK